jgi:hypothetical protein
MADYARESFMIASRPGEGYQEDIATQVNYDSTDEINES